MCKLSLRVRRAGIPSLSFPSISFASHPYLASCPLDVSRRLSVFLLFSFLFRTALSVFLFVSFPHRLVPSAPAPRGVIGEVAGAGLDVPGEDVLGGVQARFQAPGVG